MSDINDDGHEAEEFDLSNVPMDGEDEAPAGEEGGDEGEGQPAREGQRQAAAAADGERAPLAPEEVTRRYESTRIALSQERAQRRELERRLEALETRSGGEQRTQPGQPEADIDPDVDPVGALKQMRAKIAAYEAAERQENLTHEQRQAQERSFERVERALQEHETDFREDHPDYDEAAKHYAVTRAQELMQFGLQPAQVQPMLREEFAKLASTAIRAGKNPAAVVYEMAKGRGYGRKADPVDPKDVKDPKAPAGGKTKLETLQRGQRASSPLARAGGRAPSGLDAETVGNINIRSKAGREAFDKAFETMERQAKAAEGRR